MQIDEWWTWLGQYNKKSKIANKNKAGERADMMHTALGIVHKQV
jgi:hypothetical protein